MTYRTAVRGVAGWALFLGGAVTASFGQEKVTYADHILPLVEQHCAKCHNSDKKKGDLDLTSYSGTLKGGGTGVAVVSGNPESSKLIKSLTHAEEPTMPPNKPPLPEKELAVFKKWIAGGLLETSGSKAVAAAKPSVDLTLKVSDDGKPDGPPPMPKDLSIETAIHTSRSYAINGLAASPWAPVVAIAGQKQILLYNTTNLDLLGILPFAEGQPFDVKFSRSGKLLLAGGGHGAKSGKVTLWNVETGDRLTTIGNEYDSVLAADISPDQSKVALGGPDRLVKIYSTKSGDLEHKIKKHTDWVTAVAFSPNGEMLATADRNGGVTVWDADNGQELFTTPGHKGAVTALSWRTDSKLLASSSEDGTVKLWESTEGKQAKTWNAHSGGAMCVAYSRDGRFVSCGRDGSVVTRNAEGTKLKSFEFTGDIALRCAWSDDLSRIVASDFSGRVAVWDAKTGKRVGELDANPPPLAERIAAARKHLATLEAGANPSDPALKVAEAEFAKASSEMASAKAAAESAQADFSRKAAEVVRLKEIASQANPPSDINDRLAAARSAREAARPIHNQATNSLMEISKRLAVAQQTLAKAKSTFDPEAALLNARTELDRLMIAEEHAIVLRVQADIAAKKLDAERTETVLKEKEAEASQIRAKLDAEKDSRVKGQLKTTLKKTTWDLRSMRDYQRTVTGELEDLKVQLEKANREFERKRASLSTARAQNSH